MPMDRHRYPPNWQDIATQIKTAANWTCQDCGRPCRRPGESKTDFEDRLANEPAEWGDLYAYVACDESGEWGYIPRYWGRFILTVAHLDQDPSNNAPGNLRALCSWCHLKHDHPFLNSNRRNKLERAGQIPLDL
jgi:hypothetical protein